MDLGLTGKNALVMGSTKGMGFGIARRLAAEGANVAVCGRKPEGEAESIGASAMRSTCRTRGPSRR